MRFLLFVAVVFSPACLGQFGPSITSVVNSASYREGIAPGSIFTVFGYSLGPDTLVQAASYPLPLELNGISIQVTVAGKTVNCPMVYVSYGQAAAILPSNTPTGDALVRASSRGNSGLSERATVSGSAFGIYTTASSGIGLGIFTGVDYKVKGMTTPARPGEILIAWGTGLGPIEGSDSTAPGDFHTFPNVEVLVGGIPATVVYAGRSGCCAGLDQIAFEVPAGVQGCFVPVAVRTGSTTVSNFAAVSIAPFGQACTNPPPGLPQSLLVRAAAGETLKVGNIAVGPLRFLQYAGFSETQAIADRISPLVHRRVAEADVRRLLNAYRARKISAVKQILSKYGVSHADTRLLSAVRAAVSLDKQGAAAAFGIASSLEQFSAQFAAGVPPVGTCTVTREFQAPRFQAQTRSLDAGSSLTLNGPAGRSAMPRLSNGEYQVVLGSGYQTTDVPLGSYMVSAPGGTVVGAFSAALNISSNLVWTNSAAIRSVDRSQPLTVTWAGGAVPGFVLIGGAVQTNGPASIFLCVEDSGRGTFTIPSHVLSAMPTAAASNGYVFVAPHPFSNPVSIPGLDLAYFMDVSSSFKGVAFR